MCNNICMRDNYYNSVTKSHIIKYGQFFTPHNIALMMLKWVTEKGPKNILDPAVGNNVFFGLLKDSSIRRVGFEVDPNIYTFYNLSQEGIIKSDFLKSNISEKFDAIIANPPYLKFQQIEDRHYLKEKLFFETGIMLSGLSNLYLYFFVKSINLLKENGRLAFIMPYDFLDGIQGVKIKKLLTEKHLLSKMIIFDYNDVFNGVLTTAAVFLIEKNLNDYFDVAIIKKPQEVDKITSLDFRQVKYSYFIQRSKSGNWLNNNAENSSAKKFNDFARASRGIATGCNEYFVLTEETIESYKIPRSSIRKCITSSAKIDTDFFTDDMLAEKASNLFFPNQDDMDKLGAYFEYGKSIGANSSFLAKNRKAWYRVEEKKVAPIWISATCRNKIKIVRNLSDCLNLTSFHAIYVKNKSEEYVNILFCYCQTKIAESFLNEEVRRLGGGLKKLQPNDINNMKILNLNRIEIRDKERILTIYEEAKKELYFSEKLKDELNTIFRTYI